MMDRASTGSPLTKIDNLSIESCKTDHNNDSIAYKFSENEKTLVISGDTDYDEKLIEFLIAYSLSLILNNFPMPPI